MCRAAMCRQAQSISGVEVFSALWATVPPRLLSNSREHFRGFKSQILLVRKTAQNLVNFRTFTARRRQWICAPNQHVRVPGGRTEGDRLRQPQGQCDDGKGNDIPATFIGIGGHLDPNCRCASCEMYSTQPNQQRRRLVPIRAVWEVWTHDEAFAAPRLSMMRIMARRMNAATVVRSVRSREPGDGYD